MLIDFIFPRFCLGCNRIGRYICSSCEKSLVYITNTDEKHIKIPKNIDKVISLVKYNAFAKKITKTIKYKLIYTLIYELEEIILKGVKQKNTLFYKLYNYKEQFLLQPIPLHTNRLKIRGFNQSQLLALMLSKIYGYPCVDVLERVIDTKPQALLNKKERCRNVENAFKTKQRDLIINKNIILVDDVFTTGSTVDEAAKTLKDEGAKKIYVCTFALD